jgi:proprotein convertase subtilisin/kexin type 5
MLLLLDDWTAGGSIVISFSNGSTYTKTIGDCAGASFMCGSPTVPDCKLSFDVTELHTGTSLTWSIATTVAYHTLDQSFGLNNLHVEIDLCTPNCQVCDATGCLTCNASTYLHLVDKLCYAVCPVGYYGDSVSKTCLSK